MELPKKIIVADIDGGYFICTLKEVKENADENEVPIYEHGEYYHDIETALKDF